MGLEDPGTGADAGVGDVHLQSLVRCFCSPESTQNVKNLWVFLYTQILFQEQNGLRIFNKGPASHKFGDFFDLVFLYCTLFSRCEQTMKGAMLTFCGG